MFWPDLRGLATFLSSCGRVGLVAVPGYDDVLFLRRCGSLSFTSAIPTASFEVAGTDWLLLIAVPGVIGRPEDLRPLVLYSLGRWKDEDEFFSGAMSSPL